VKPTNASVPAMATNSFVPVALLSGTPSAVMCECPAMMVAAWVTRERPCERACGEAVASLPEPPRGASRVPDHGALFAELTVETSGHLMKAPERRNNQDRT
jgi:hypothetical protein